MLLFMSPLVQARSLYSWTDENGTVHFGATPPPPEQQRGLVVEETEMPGSPARNHQGRSAVMGLEATWWTRGHGKVSRFLELKRGNFSLGEEWMDMSGRAREVYASGPYEYDNGQLVLTYFAHARNPSKLDTTEHFGVAQLTEQRLVLHDANGINAVGYQRLNRTSAGDMTRRLNGRWHDSRYPGVVYEFDAGIFHVEQRRQTGGVSRVRSGNWYWDDPVINMTVVIDRYQPVDGLRPPVLHWQIIEKTLSEIRIHDQGQGSVFSLKR